LKILEYQPAAKADLLDAWLQVADDRGVDAAENGCGIHRKIQPGYSCDNDPGRP